MKTQLSSVDFLCEFFGNSDAIAKKIKQKSRELNKLPFK